MFSQRNWLAGIAVAAAGTLVHPAHAQYAGPADLHASKVSSILEAPKDDQDVLLQGQLLRKIGGEKYLFSDGSGEIVVEIDDDDFPKEPVNEQTTVELRGEVDTGRDRPPEVEVDTVRILK